jgi:hypothetical protein
MELGLNVIVSLAFPVSALFEARNRPKSGKIRFAKACTAMPKEKTGLKTFHATMAVTRLEEWCVEAKTPEEARALLSAGEGHRCHHGDCVHIELETMNDA